MRRDDGKAELPKRRYPEPGAEIPIEKGAAPAGSRQRPCLPVTETGEHAVEFAGPARAHEAPFHQQAAKQAAHRNVARPGDGLRQVGDRAVALLHPADVNDVRIEVDILPQQPELLAGPSAGEKREGDVDALLLVGARRLQQQRSPGRG